MNPIVGFLGWVPDAVNERGDSFTRACLEAIEEPRDDTPVYHTLDPLSRVALTYGAYKQEPAGHRLHALFAPLDFRLRHADQPMGRGAIFEQIRLLRLALSPMPSAER